MEFVPVLSVVGVLVVIFLLGAIGASRYKKAAPHEALIATGKGGQKITVGGGMFVAPVLYKLFTLDLRAHLVPVERDNIYCKNRVPITVKASLVYKVRGDEASVKLAAQALQGKSEQEISDLVQSVAEGAFRDICGKMTPEEINEDREEFQNQVTTSARGHFEKIGVDLVSFVVTHIFDKQNYFESLGAPAVASVQREARQKRAEADRAAIVTEVEQKQASETRRAETEAEIAEAQRTMNVRKAQYAAQVAQEQAIAEQAGPKAEALAKQEVVDAQTELAQKEAARREKELLATVVRPAEAQRDAAIAKAEGEKQATMKRAEATQFELTQEGAGEAAKIKNIGQAEADVIQLKGNAEAAAIKAKLLAEAEGWTRRAEAMKQYNDAAMALELGQRLIDRLPEMVEASARALGAVNKIEVFDFGGSGAPTSNLMGVAPKNVVQTLTWLKEATGIDLAALFQGVQNKLGETTQTADLATAQVKTKETPRPRSRTPTSEKNGGEVK